jgi:putative transposase
LSKVSEVDQDAVRADFWDIFDLDETLAPGDQAVGEARRRARQFEATWGRAYPGAVATVVDGLDELVAHLHYPRAHWPRIRHTNLIERTFGETRRRVKVIGRLPGERSALSLLWAVLDRAASGWRGITYNPADVRLLQMIRRDLGLTTRRKEHPEPDPHGDVADVA